MSVNVERIHHPGKVSVVSTSMMPLFTYSLHIRMYIASFKKFKRNKAQEKAETSVNDDSSQIVLIRKFSEQLKQKQLKSSTAL